MEPRWSLAMEPHWSHAMEPRWSLAGTRLEGPGRLDEAPGAADADSREMPQSAADDATPPPPRRALSGEQVGACSRAPLCYSGIASGPQGPSAWLCQLVKQSKLRHCSISWRRGGGGGYSFEKLLPVARRRGRRSRTRVWRRQAARSRREGRDIPDVPDNGESAPRIHAQRVSRANTWREEGRESTHTHARGDQDSPSLRRSVLPGK